MNEAVPGCAVTTPRCMLVQALTTCPLPVALIDEAGTFVEVSEAWRTLFRERVPDGQWKGKHHADVWPRSAETGVPPWARYLERALRGETIVKDAVVWRDRGTTHAATYGIWPIGPRRFGVYVLDLEALAQNALSRLQG